MNNDNNKALADTLRTLVAYTSTPDNPSEAKRLMEYVAERITDSSNHTVTIDEHAGVPYLIARPDTDDAHIVWNVIHVDVVPAGKDLFTLRQDGDKLFGRGTYDMKGILASFLHAFTQLSDSAKNKTALMLSADEEVGGAQGVGVLAKQHISEGVALVLDGGHEWTLEEKARGVLHMAIDVTGKTAHAARPWLGDSATSRLVKVLQELEQWYESTYRSIQDDYERPSMNIGTIRGGEAANQVAEHAMAVIDFRVATAQQLEAIKTKIESFRSKHIDAHERISAQPMVCDIMNEHVQDFMGVIKSLGLKESGKERHAFGAQDARFIAELAVPTIVTRPPGGNQHSDGEWVSLSGLEQLKQVLINYHENFAKKH